MCAAVVIMLGVAPGGAAPTSRPGAGDERSQAALLAVLDQLVALERAGGGWTFTAPPHERPHPLTAPLRLAEAIAAPFGVADWDIVVLRSPGTPAAALALLDGYRRSGRAEYLTAAARAGDLLLRIQLPSGGWFSEMPVARERLACWFAATVRRTTLDDDVTTGGARLLLALWRVTGTARYRLGAERALDLLVRAQLPSGAWPLVWRPGWKRAVWPTFEDLATLNDGATPAAIATLLEGADVLARDDLRAAAVRGGEWLIAAQDAPAYAGWAQQYDARGRPAWARRFEPPALASWESRYAIESLLALADATGDRRYCVRVARAITWLAASALRPGCWARFYARGTNAPVYVAADGRMVATPADARPGYTWTGDFGVPALFVRLGVAPPGAAVTLVAGDPGACPGETPHGFERDAPDDPRALVARAALLRGQLDPPTPSVCAGINDET